MIGQIQSKLAAQLQIGYNSQVKRRTASREPSDAHPNPPAPNMANWHSSEADPGTHGCGSSPSWVNT